MIYLHTKYIEEKLIMSHSKFVSSIPNNNLEPVFVGGGSGPASKSSGTYVPVFLRNQPTQEQTHTGTLTQTKEFKMTDDDFPSFLGSKSGTKTTVDPPKTITHYSDALKKDIDKPKTKVTKSNTTSYSSNKNKKRILDDYSDHYSDEYNSDEY